MSYWLPDSTVLAEEYPGHPDADEARRKVRRFLNAGIAAFLDLTRPEDGLKPYAGFLFEEAVSRSLEVLHARHPVRDMGIPSIGDMAAILDRLDEWMGQGRSAYVHCWRGIGRTGTVVGCLLVRRGMDGQEALATVQALYETTGHQAFDPWSPQTEAQRQFVVDWADSESQGR